MTSIGRIININGYLWEDVTNQTTSGPIYDARDVIKCGGQVPTFVSCYSVDYEKKKPKKIENEFIKNIITNQKKVGNEN